MRHHTATIHCVKRRTAEGFTKREIIRCLERCIAREVFKALPEPPQKNPSPRPLDKDRSIERFHRILLGEWDYIRPWTSEVERAQAYDGFIHFYNHHRAHGALG